MRFTYFASALMLACACAGVPRDDAPDSDVPDTAEPVDTGLLGARLAFSPPISLSANDPDAQHHGSIAALPSGRVLGTWHAGLLASSRGYHAGGDVYAGRFEAPRPVVSGVGAARKIDVTGDGDAGFVLGWEVADGSLGVRWVAADGRESREAVRLFPNAPVQSVDVGVDPTSETVLVVWHEAISSSYRAWRLTLSLEPIGADFWIGDSPSSEYQPDAVARPGGGFLVAMVDAARHVVLVPIDADGALGDTPIRADDDELPSPRRPKLAIGPRGHVALAWPSVSTITAQVREGARVRFAGPDLNWLGPSVALGGDTGAMPNVEISGEHAFVAWEAGLAWPSLHAQAWLATTGEPLTPPLVVDGSRCVGVCRAAIAAYDGGAVLMWARDSPSHLAVSRLTISDLD